MNKVFSLILFLFAFNAAHAQPGLSPINDFFLSNADTTKEILSVSKYYVVEKEESLPIFVTEIRKLSNKVSIVRVENKLQYELLKQSNKIAPANDEWKLTYAARLKLTDQPGLINTFIISGIDFSKLIASLDSFKTKLTVLNINHPANAVLIRCSNQVMNELVKLDDVSFIDIVQKARPETGIIGYERSINHLNAVDYEIPGANGRNTAVGIKEQTPDSNDLDLYKRILPSPLASDEISNHATVVASIIGGAGNSFYDGRGIAYASRFFPSSFDNLFADPANILNASNVSVQNHSYGTVIQQFYGAEAVSYDKQTWENKNLVHVFSAGNQGTEAATDGPYANIQGFANLTGNFKIAKNVITVAAIDNKENILSVSSSGPTYDGRLAPQITALGSNGTSDAAAIVSGTVAVMQQVYKDSNAAVLPPASLIKAVLYNTIKDIYTKGIDYKTGYGLLDSYAAIKAIQNKNYDHGTISQNDTWTKEITIPANTSEIKITLCWTDSAAQLNNLSALINDIDIELEQISNGTIYKPWILNTTASIATLQQPPVRGRDSLNTSEQISIELPEPGLYQLRAKGTHIASINLPFDIAINIDSFNQFAFLNPVHTSDINRSENPQLAIRWNAVLKDTNQTGKLSVSYDHGINWNEIESNQKISVEKYLWTIRDTNSVARFRMETPFGNFESEDVIITDVIRPVVDYNCVDSFRLSWNKHIYANAYKIYALLDSPYLKEISTVTDTFSVFQRNTNPSRIYAVKPVLNNGVDAARSIAFNLDFQGVDCFYKTFYYNLLDLNKIELILELSTTANVDSIYFENVTADGKLIENYGSLKVNNNQFIYKQLVAEIPAGTNYFRARIILKSKQQVNTEIISILTSGPQKILFYPNPVHRNMPLQYILQQGFFGDNSLQFFDVSGRLIKSYLILPDKIDLSLFPIGIVIYKLFDSKHTVVQTGKILIE